jgi:hypothetical protein
MVEREVEIFCVKPFLNLLIPVLVVCGQKILIFDAWAVVIRIPDISNLCPVFKWTYYLNSDPAFKWLVSLYHFITTEKFISETV